MKNSKTKMITGALCLLILSTGFIIYGANPVLKQGKGLKKVSNDKYTFGDIGENLGHRLYNQDGTIISRSNNAIKRAHGNGNIIVTYNRIDVCSNKYQSVKGDIGPLIFVAADLADWNNPLLKWDTGVTSFRYRQPGNIGKGKYNFHFDNVSNPGLSKLDGTLWREGIDFSYDGNLSGIYNIGNGFTIYEDGEEITSKIEKVGSGNGFDGEILTDIGNNEIYSVKGRNWCTKNGTVWRWGALTDPINGIIKSGESISENSGIFGPTATNGFCLFINGKEITSYASEIANEKLTNTGIGAYQTKHSNWCSKQGNDFSISANIVSNYGKANGFVIKDAYGNDVCSKEQKSYILPDSRDHSSLTPVVADLLNWTSVSVPKGKVYVDPVKGRVKFFSGNETIDYAQSIDNQIFSFNYVGAPTVGGFASVNNWNNHEIASFSLILPFHVPVNSIFNFQIDLYTPGLGYCEFYFVKKKVMPYGLIYERIASLGSVATLPSGWSTINCLYNEALKILYSSDTYLLMIETGERPDWTAFPIGVNSFPSDNGCGIISAYRDLGPFYSFSEFDFCTIPFKIKCNSGAFRFLFSDTTIADIFPVNITGKLSKIQLKIKENTGKGYFRVTLGQYSSSMENYQYLDSKICNVALKNEADILDVPFNKMPLVFAGSQYCLIFESLDTEEGLKISFALNTNGNSGFLYNSERYSWTNLAGSIWLKAYVIPDCEAPKDPVISYNYRPIKEVVAENLSSGTPYNYILGTVFVNPTTGEVFNIPEVLCSNNSIIFAVNYNYKKYADGVVTKNLNSTSEWENGPTDSDYSKIYIDPASGRFRFHNENSPDGRLTVSYNFNASAQDKRSLVYGELPIDPGSGRVLFHAQDVPLYPTDEMMSSLFNYNNFSGTKPLPPLVLNAIPNISDAPFKLKGSKQEETSVWLDKNGNKTEIVEQNPKSEWSYDLVLDKGNNDLKFSSKIFELESDHNDYSLAYHVKKPVIENESPVNSSTLVLTGTKGKNTSVELLEKKANQSPGNGNDADGSTFSFFDNSILNGEIVKNDGSEVDNLQSVFNNEDISIYADGNNLFTAHTYLVTAMDLSDESGYANWQDPNTPEQNQIAVDLRTGRFKFRQDNLPSGTLTVKYSYFKKISDNGDALVWNYNYGNLTAGDNSITVRSADKMGNVSEPVNKILKYASDRIGTDLINYEYFANEPDGIENDVKITINKDINSYLNGFTYQMTREQNKAALSTFDNPNIMVGDQTICFITNIADSPYLTLHIKGTGQELITHKKILSKQLTSLVPFIDDFNSGDSLKKQGTYTKVPNGTSSGWSVDASSGTLKSSAATLDKLFVPQNTPTWQDYQFTIYVKRLNSSPINLSLLYKVTDLNNYYEFKLDETQNKSENYTVTENAPSAIPNTVNNGVAWSKFDSSFVPVKVEVRNHKPSGNTYVKTFIDDRQVNYFIYNMPLYGGIGIKADHTQIAVDKLEIKPLK